MASVRDVHKRMYSAGRGSSYAIFACNLTNLESVKRAGNKAKPSDEVTHPLLNQ